MVPRIHIVGRKNSGKTTLIVALIQELSGRGLRVGTIKHTHHHHEFDAPGKDSFLHRQAGAAVVGLVGPKMAAAFCEYTDEQRLRGIPQLEPLFADCDLVLVEGNQQSLGTKVEVWRAVTDQPPLVNNLSGVCALITDDHLPDEIASEMTCPVWPRGSVEAIADGLLELISAD
ncbi:MAG: molybdopterin-guanine dinucleotide biosynthesis protein B [Planctomycetaceae bacterium]